MSNTTRQKTLATQQHTDELAIRTVVLKVRKKWVFEDLFSIEMF